MAKEASLKLIELIDTSLNNKKDREYFEDLGKTLCSVYYNREQHLINKWLLNYENYSMNYNLRSAYINCLNKFKHTNGRIIGFKDELLSLEKGKELLENFISVLKELEFQEKSINNDINNKEVRTTKVNLINKNKVADLNNKLITDINNELYTNFNDGYLSLIEDKKENIDISNYEKMIDFHNKLEKIKTDKRIKLVDSNTCINKIDIKELDEVFFTDIKVDSFSDKFKSIKVFKNYDTYKFCINAANLNLNNICNEIIKVGFNIKEDYIVSKELLYKCLSALIEERTNKGKCINCNRKLGMFYKKPVCRECI